MQIVSRPPSEASAGRIAPLAVLPVFLDLGRKPALVAGGSDAAAWKAELLLAAGANLTVVSKDGAVEPEMRALVDRERGSGRVIHRDAEWEPGLLAGTAIAICDAAGEVEAAAFLEACRKTGTACNVIDKPEFCTVQFGSIVNRSPLVVGISTAGAAPVLAQAVRRRIETLLPPSLAAWAERARAIRADVTARLRPGAERRAFWKASSTGRSGGRRRGRTIRPPFGPRRSEDSAT